MERMVIHLMMLLAGAWVAQGQNTLGRRCDVPADVVFLMDASDSITDIQWLEEKLFVADLIDSLEVERYAVHVGVIVFSTDIGFVIDLQPFKTKAQLKILLDKAVHLNAGTDTGRAIARLIEMSDTQGRIELDAKQIAVVITDGRSLDVLAVKNQAARARNEYAIDFIAVGVGNETFREELEQIVGPNNGNSLFQVGSFQQRAGIKQHLQDIICEPVITTTATTTPESTTTSTTASTTSPYLPPFDCSEPADVIFLIDGSYSIKTPDWIQSKQFVSYLINGLDIRVNSINVGLIVFGTEIGDVVSLKPYKTKYELRERASGLVQPDVGDTDTALGLRRLRTMMREDGRAGVPHIAIIITDGVSSDQDQTRIEASLAKSEGITIFVVGVGDTMVSQEWEDMSSSPQTFFDAPNFRSLIGIIEQLRDNICTAIKSTTPLPITTTTTPAIPDLCLQCLVEKGVGFNPFPADCEKYVMCLPMGPTYDPVVKLCPFGLFWSNEAVSCLDSRYVQCPNDRCRSMSPGSTYASSSANCRSYFRCSNSRSTPVCCETGFRYVDRFGCTYDPSCRDPCPLEITINNEGACKFRVDPKSYYTYFEVVPGQGQIKRSCSPGQVYSSKLCACTYDAASVSPELACSALINVPFNGSFEDMSRQPQPIQVRGVTLSNTGSAYFDGTSYFTFPSTANVVLGETFVVKLKFRRRDDTQRQVWNDHWSWGFQEWYNNASMTGSSPRVIVSNTPITAPDPGKPKGALEKPLEIITIAKDGTVIRDPRYEVKVNTSWPGPNQKKISVLSLGSLGKLTTPVIQNGIIYVPGSKNRILIQEPIVRVTGSSRFTWKIISLGVGNRTGTVERTGEGAVPLNIQLSNLMSTMNSQQQFGFDLRAPLRERWWVLAPGGQELDSGEGPMPLDLVNRYRGYSKGTLVKVFDRGEQIERPDESQLQFGNGEIPKRLRDQYNMDAFLGQARVLAKTWAVLAADGTVLEQGKGEMPTSIRNRFSSDSSVTVITLTSQDGGGAHWEVQRTSGVKLLEGRGVLPDGIAGFVRGKLQLPQISQITEWQVTLPDGSVRTGTGDIPQSILDMFSSINSGPVRVLPPAGSDLIKRWTITLPDGSAKIGAGVIPPEILASIRSGPMKMQTRWEIVLPDGQIRTGYGDLPSDLAALMRTSESMSPGMIGKDNFLA
ncbi:collagen alpha-4(vi) chain [Plakobranchus ocellatus]|uniref:Collagen alpha-4(Vi) chain n=1 Tax=Plakobranchus ocellatus TaxID=259542 RepID=A0AAV3ZZ13_9GAST|nr:collagen alpha-4(vi) chain [Plakobranchus ocellatus]